MIIFYLLSKTILMIHLKLFVYLSDLVEGEVEFISLWIVIKELTEENQVTFSYR